jgi:hypothetical protein
MTGVLIALIVSAAVVVGYYIDYLNNKVVMKADESDLKKEVNDLRTVMHQMKKRIENLEAIAAGEPDSFHQIELSDSKPVEDDHVAAVNEMVNKRKSSS